jgi:hypothetical protein
MSNVLGTGDWKVGLPPKDVLKKTKSSEREAPHHMQSIEMQTDIQDEADKFASYVRAFKQKNPDKADIFPKAIKLMAKLFVDSKLNDEEKRFSDKNNLDIYISPSDLFRTIKSDRGGKELYKYAIKVLAGSVMDDL